MVKSPLADGPLRGGHDELDRARTMRLEADRRATMSERLARVHSLCKQMTAIKGVAARS